MASEAEIKAAIEGIVTYYSVYTIGLTDNPERRRIEHGNPMFWHQWNAASEQAARNVEAYFIDKGMKGGTGGGGGADYVYIFLV